MAFTNDGQINELASITGVFDEQLPLDPTILNPDPYRVRSFLPPLVQPAPSLSLLSAPFTLPMLCFSFKHLISPSSTNLHA